MTRAPDFREKINSGSTPILEIHWDSGRSPLRLLYTTVTYFPIYQNTVRVVASWGQTVPGPPFHVWPSGCCNNSSNIAFRKCGPPCNFWRPSCEILATDLNTVLTYWNVLPFP